MWNDKSYSAAVAEFDQIVKEDPNSSLGLQSLLRASFTRTLFLGQHDQALKGFKTYLERAGSSDSVPRVEMEIGEIYFNRLKEYEASVQHYSAMLQNQSKHPQEDLFLFQYRLGRSLFLLGSVRRAILEYEKAIQISRDPIEKAKVYLDIASAWYSLGDEEKSAFSNSLASLQKIGSLVPDQHPFKIEAEFWIASAEEELDQLESAYSRFSKILSKYPAPNVVRVKLHRIDERLKRKRK